MQRLADLLDRARPRALGLIADNGIEWVVADLAAERAHVPLVPLPAFFTLGQLQHAADATGMDALLCDAPGIAARARLHARRPACPASSLPWFRRKAAIPVELPAGTSKITFTSGTTGTPKGVCLSAEQQRTVAASLVTATQGVGIARHLSLLPLAVLLENIAGVYAPLAAGATCCLPSLGAVGVGGATGFDPRVALGAIERWQADSVILLPQMLAALTAVIEAGAPRPARLRFAAVGGAKVSPALIERARAAGIPAYEGYGLSECASVVALNVPGANRPGSVGRPLPHARVRIDDGEIVVDGAGFLGYVGEHTPGPDSLRTGDLGHVDADGFLHIDGRRKHQLITSFGRNVAPEWPEAELAVAPAVAQAAVFGEARPQLAAVLVPAHARGSRHRAGRRRARRQRAPARLRARRRVAARRRAVQRRQRAGHRQRPRAPRRRVAALRRATRIPLRRLHRSARPCRTLKCWRSRPRRRAPSCSPSP